MTMTREEILEDEIGTLKSIIVGLKDEIDEMKEEYDTLMAQADKMENALAGINMIASKF